MNKKGQVYLIAGIIVVSIIIGFVAIVNYAKKGQTQIITDMKDELKIETQKVLEYDLAQSQNKIQQFGKDYSDNAGSDIELYFITGETSDLNAYKYLNGAETDVSSNLTIDESNNKIIFDIGGTDYEFNLGSGNNFYFVVSQEIKGERFVETG